MVPEFLIMVASLIEGRAQARGCSGLVVVAYGLSCSVTRGILPVQGLNPCRLHWQADSYPL